jgi:hypothetical protein
MSSNGVLVHQVHPVKLGFDITASVVSNFLLWRHRLVWGILTRYLLPPIGSAVVLRYGDVATLERTERGRYVLEHMPPATTALRLAGDTVMAVGSWRRRPGLMLAGGLLVAAGWSHGLFFEPLSRDR